MAVVSTLIGFGIPGDGGEFCRLSPSTGDLGTSSGATTGLTFSVVLPKTGWSTSGSQEVDRQFVSESHHQPSTGTSQRKWEFASHVALPVSNSIRRKTRWSRYFSGMFRRLWRGYTKVRRGKTTVTRWSLAALQFDRRNVSTSSSVQFLKNVIYGIECAIQDNQ